MCSTSGVAPGDIEERDVIGASIVGYFPGMCYFLLDSLYLFSRSDVLNDLATEQLNSLVDLRKLLGKASALLLEVLHVINLRGDRVGKLGRSDLLG